MNNREIAEKLFVSENTIKTHCSRDARSVIVQYYCL